jgi:hypothetical protein
MGEERDLSPPSNKKKKHGSTNKPEEIAEPDDDLWCAMIDGCVALS